MLVNKSNRSFWLFLGVLALVLLLALLVSVFFNFCATKYTKDWPGLLQKSTKTIEKAVRRILLVKPIFLVPTICFFMEVFLVFLAINSSSLLVTPSVKEFRVVGACQEELCINNSTNKFFVEGDLCLPEYFK